MRGASSFHVDTADCGVAPAFVVAGVPLWLFALAAAAAAPACVRLYASSLEKKARLRTERALEGARRDLRLSPTHEGLIEGSQKEQAERTPS